MLAEHLANLEQRLRAGSDVEMATPRERLSTEFLVPMFGSELSVSVARIIDCQTMSGPPLPMTDVLLCRARGPRLDIDGVGACVLAESVVAAITVLPRLDAEVMANAVGHARSIKRLRRRGLLPAGSSLADPPDPEALGDAARAIACHVVAFDGPAEMAQVHVWLKSAYRAQGIVEPDLPDSGRERCRFASPALDGVFVLGRGHLNFDNMPLSLFDDASRQAAYGACWSLSTSAQGSLLSLFVQITQAAAALAGTGFDPRVYLTGLPAASVRLGN